MMNFRRSMTCLLGVSVLTLFALPAFARPPRAAADCAQLVDSACVAELESLCIATEDAASLSSRDRNGMIGKVLGANVKLAARKVVYADAKLDNYDSKLNALNEAAKPKISVDDFVALLDKLLDAQVCVGSL